MFANVPDNNTAETALGSRCAVAVALDIERLAAGKPAAPAPNSNSLAWESHSGLSAHKDE